MGDPFGSHFYVQGPEFFNKNEELILKDKKVEGCGRAWRLLLGDMSMYKGWSFSIKKKEGMQKVGKVVKSYKIIKKHKGFSSKVENMLL